MTSSPSGDSLDVQDLVRRLANAEALTPAALHLELLLGGWPTDDPLRLAYRREIPDEKIDGFIEAWQHISETSTNELAVVVARDNLWSYTSGKPVDRFAMANKAIAGYARLASDERILADDQVDYLGDAIRIALELSGQEDTIAGLRSIVVERFERHAEAADVADSTALTDLHRDFPVVPLGDPEFEAAELRASTRLQHHHAVLSALRVMVATRKSLEWDVLTLEKHYAQAQVASANDLTLRARLWEAWLDLTSPSSDVGRRARIAFVNFERERSLVLDPTSQFGVLVVTEQKCRQWGLAELASELQTEIQTLQLDLHPVVVEVPIPRKVIESQVAQITEADGWRRQLVAFGLALGPLTGSFAENQKRAEEILDQQPLGRTMRSFKIGAFNALEAEAEGEDKKLAEELGRIETQHAGLLSQVLLGSRHVIGQSLSGVTDADLSDFLQREAQVALDEERALRISVGLRRFFDGDYDLAAHTLLPRIEHVLRVRASAHGSVIRPTDGTQRGGVRLLKEVLEQLDGRLSDDWVQCFRSLLNERYGHNLRNQILHGLVPGTRDWEAALVTSLMLASLFLSVAHESDAE